MFLQRAENTLRYLVLLFFCLGFRLMRLPVPGNVEPVMASLLPVSKKFGEFSGFLFGASAIAFFDLATNNAGWWTLAAAIPYGLVGFLASKYFSYSKKPGRKEYVIASVGGTLLFDAITAPIFGFMFGQTLEATVLGQIPFTLWHLAGNITFAFLLSPLIQSSVLENESFSLSGVLKKAGVRA